MANTVIGASVQVDFQSVGNMRKALKEANQELLAMQDQFGAASTEAINAAKKVADLKDRIEDARETADLFDPGKKFQAFVTLGSQIAAGFSAVQGAMALVGSESEDVQKALLKVQGAMALAQGLSQLKDFGKSWQQVNIFIKSNTIFMKANAAATALTANAMKLFGVSVGTTSTAFKVLKTAIISTGVGALLILVTEAIALIDSWTSSTKDASKAQEELNEQIEKTKKSLDESMRSSQRWVDRQVDRIKKEEEIKDLSIDEQKNSKEILKLKQEILDIDIRNAKIELATKENLLSTEEELILKEKIFRSEKEKTRLDLTAEKEENDKKNKETIESNEKYLKKLEEQKRKEAEIRRKALDLQFEITESLTTFNLNEQGKELFELRKKYNEQKKILEAGGESTVALTELYEKQKQEIIDKYANIAREKEKQFLEDLNKLNEEIRLSGIKDQREKERTELSILYSEKLAELEKNEKYNEDQKAKLRAALLIKQKIDEDALTEKFRQEDLQKRAQDLQNIASNEKFNFNERLTALKSHLDLANQLTFESEDERKAYIEKITQDIIKLQKDEKQHRIDVENAKYQAVSQSISAISNLVGAFASDNEKQAKKMFNIQKALNISQAIIDTYAAANSIFRQAALNPATVLFPAQPFIAAGVAIATGLANVAKISQQKFQGGNAGGGTPPPPPGLGGGGSPMQPALSTAVQGQALNAEAINNLGNQSLRAYVMNSDIQNNNQRNAYLQRNARIG